MQTMYVYILSNNSQVLYIGVTNDLHNRMFQHTQDCDPDSFVGRYNLDRLVYYEDFRRGLWGGENYADCANSRSVGEGLSSD